MSKRGGFMALITVMLIGAVALVMALNSSLLGLGALDFGYLADRGAAVSTITDACLEEALGQLRFDQTYSGQPSLSFAGGSCIIEVVVSGEGEERIITVTGRSDDFFQTLMATVLLGDRSVTILDFHVV